MGLVIFLVIIGAPVLVIILAALLFGDDKDDLYDRIDELEDRLDDYDRYDRY